MSALLFIIGIYLGMIYGIELTKPDASVTELEAQIDKAKEIIRLFLSERFNESEWQSIQNKAEQFLEEE